ncbi:MAG: hypothetical protein A2X09_09445 [Bacteroidetes bacterium GWF2_43_11]|nr:MAG: hypothetical protein A2X09_09445 [Bacteroidetes bacterium GWF2_43_11]
MKQLRFDDAPGRLLALMIEFLPMVSKYEAKYGATNPQVQFYRKMMETLRYSLLYMNDVEFIFKRNSMLEENIELLSERLHTIESRLALYEEIRTNVSNGELAQMMARVQSRMDEIPSDPFFLTGQESTPEDVMASFRRHIAITRLGKMEKIEINKNNQLEEL